MNFNKIFDLFGKKIFWGIATCYWFVFFFGKNVDFELQNISNESYKLIIIGLGILSSFIIAVDLVSTLGGLMKKAFEGYQSNKKRHKKYLEVIDTITSYGNIDGLGILFSLYRLPSRGEHYKKSIPKTCSKSTFSILNSFSEITVDSQSFYNVKLLNPKEISYQGEIISFDFDQEFFVFLREYFRGNNNEVVDLSSNFLEK
jgi:hypothetical protein